MAVENVKLRSKPVQRSKSVSSYRDCGPTCHALRTAVTGLTRLDDFEMEKIGAGFFANVFKVRHNVTGEVMVLKLIKTEHRRTHSLHEVQLMKSFHHPNILRFYGVCVHEGQLHPLVEFINGGVLDELLLDLKKELPWPVRFTLTLDIARGMSYLHSKGVFHRDLTSKNVLIRRLDGGMLQAVVADFGLAAKIPPVGASMSVVGSPYWMAPEVLRGEIYNEKADVFSYGIVVCEILARVDADPDNLPRLSTFGLDCPRLREMCSDAPSLLIQLAAHCCQLSASHRYTFATIVDILSQTGVSALWDVSSCIVFEQPSVPSPQGSEDLLGLQTLVDEVPLLCLSPPMPLSRNISKENMDIPPFAFHEFPAAPQQDPREDSESSQDEEEIVAAQPKKIPSAADESKTTTKSWSSPQISTIRCRSCSPDLRPRQLRARALDDNSISFSQSSVVHVGSLRVPHAYQKGHQRSNSLKITMSKDFNSLLTVQVSSAPSSPMPNRAKPSFPAFSNEP